MKTDKINYIQTEEDFLSIRLRHDFLVLRSWAEWCIQEYNCDFEKLAKKALDEREVFGDGLVGGFWNYRCLRLYEQWDYDQMGPIEISPEFFLGDGHHRALALGCLILQGKILYEPVKFVMVPSSGVGPFGHSHVFGCRPRYSAKLAAYRARERERDALRAAVMEKDLRKPRRSVSEVKGLLVRMDAEALAVDMETDVFRPFFGTEPS